MIGLREGLEAVLIVTIIATFLRQNNASMRGMWFGVGAGVALATAVGIALNAVEQALPQDKQEMMETVIGGIAVFFVTGMILWMRTHARTMKRELESQAADALASGTLTALTVMAFLAVLREGFETSVFLVATFQHASSAPSAVSGAVLGIVSSVILGWAMFVGGVRINLQKFFKITGVFLVFVAAGLVMFAFRTAHEAGWVNVGQGRTVDLAWLAPNGSIRSALLTGVLGIPSDPRVIEVLAWFAYLLPMLALMFWPAKWALSATTAQRARLGGAGAAVVLAAILFAAVPMPTVSLPTEAPDSTGATVQVSVTGTSAALERANHTYALGNPTPTTDHGADTRWTASKVMGTQPTTLSLQDLIDLNGGRIPSGLGAAAGPFTASWTDQTQLIVLTRNGGLVDGELGGALVLRYSGGGLTTPRILTVEGWHVAPTYADTARATITDTQSARNARALWKSWVPVALLILAAGLGLQALRRRSQAAASGPIEPAASERSHTGSTSTLS